MTRLGRRLPLTILLVFLALSSNSCSRKVTFDNPFDPNVSLTPPGDLQVISITDTTLTLRWSSSYKVYGSSQMAASWIIVEAGSDNAAFSVLDSLSAADTTGTVRKIFKTNLEYYFRIKERLSANISSVSNIVKAEVTFPAPAGFRLTTANESLRQFTWQGEAGPVARYRIERRLSELGNFSVIGTVPSNTTTFVDTTAIITDTTYEYRLCAITQHGDSSSFDSMSVVVDFPPPTHLHVTSLSPTSVDIVWRANHSFESNYEVWESVNGQSFNEIAFLPRTSNSLDISSLSESSDYSFEVAAVSKYNMSKKSNIAISFVNSPAALLYSFPVYFESSLAFSPDGGLLARSGIDSTVVYATGDGSELNSTQNGGSTWGGGPECTFSPDGKLLASNGNGMIDLWSSDTLGLVALLPNGPNTYGLVRCLAFTPDGNTIAATTNNLTVQLWDLVGKTKLSEYSGHFDWLGNSYVAVSPDGRYVATGDSLALLDLSTGKLVRSLSTSQTLGEVAFNPSGEYVATVAEADNSIMLYSSSNGALVHTFPAAGNYYNMSPGLFCFDPTGADLVIAGSKVDPSSVHIYDIQSGAILTTLNTPSQVYSVAISPLGNLIAACNDDGTIRVWALKGVWITDH